jgi:hypothetical protein
MATQPPLGAGSKIADEVNTPDSLDLLWPRVLWPRISEIALRRRSNTRTVALVLGDLGAAIEDLDVPVERESLVEAIALRDRLDARIAQATGSFEATGWWGVDASASMTAWLRPTPG